MSRLVLTALMTCTALLALAALLVSLKRAHAHRDWGLSATFILAMAWVANGPTALVTLTAPIQRSIDTFGHPYEIYPYRLARLSLYATLAGIALAAAVAFVSAIRRRAKVAPAGLAALALVLTASISTVRNGDVATGYAQILLVAAVIAATVAGGSARSVCVGVGTFGVLFAAASGLLSLVGYERAVSDCGSVKCGPLGVIYFGVAGNENALAMALAVSLPFIWLGFRGEPRVWLSAYIAAMVLVTGSRTSTLAVLVTLLLLLLTRPSLDGPRPSPARILLASAVALAGLVVSIGFPYHRDFAPGEYSSRGLLWMTARDRIGSSPTFGLGSHDWEHVAYSPLVAYSVHNQWLDVRYIAGWVGTVLFAVLVVVVLRSAASNGLLLPILATLTPVFCVSILERPWSIGRFDWLSFSLAATVILSTAREPDEEQLDGDGSDAREGLLPVVGPRP